MPVLGRGFSPNENQTARQNVVLSNGALGEYFWPRSNIVGALFASTQETVTVVA